MRSAAELIEINEIVIFGDSLSDTATMRKTFLAKFSGVSVDTGRFSNGNVYVDYLSERFLSTLSAVQNIAVNNDKFSGTKSDPILIRKYTIGGATAHDYSKRWTFGKPVQNITGQILSSLKKMRTEAERDDRFIRLKAADKKKMLVIEWTGANDLITINDRPSLKAAKSAVAARIAHLEKMIQSGYEHFVLFNLPDLSLTPRYQNTKNKTSIEKVKDIVDHINQQLTEEIAKIQAKYPACNIHLYDVNDLFRKAYSNPQEYQLDANKLNQPFLTSIENLDNDTTTTAEGFMFWDEVHPTTAVHQHIEQNFYDTIFAKHYSFKVAYRSKVEQFKAFYGMVLEDETHCCCGIKLPKRHSIAYSDDNLTQEAILSHARLGMNNYGLFATKTGQRTARIVQALGWSLDETGTAETQKTVPSEFGGVNIIARIDEEALMSNEAEADTEVRRSAPAF